ncbi:hypothetical protein E4U43_001828 [Claviceps pusilla]|uniref:Uncharacterized protein n=1 Tax=Claviceps pusilla TaxID=123648 RepID=A0A9P7N738_9HYPO|nr:hypothetical protein E4U43_001828 [Claviceps pusilla]
MNHISLVSARSLVDTSTSAIQESGRLWCMVMQHRGVLGADALTSSRPQFGQVVGPRIRGQEGGAHAVPHRSQDRLLNISVR